MLARLPALNLKAKLILLMVMLLTLTLGSEVWVSLGTQQEIVETTQQKVKGLARGIQIGVQQLTSVGPSDPNRLHDYVKSLNTSGLQVSIASSENLIINSSDPHLIGSQLMPRTSRELSEKLKQAEPDEIITITPKTVGPQSLETTVYLIPVQVEDHLLGYVQLVANFGDFAEPLTEDRKHTLSFAFAIFAIGLAFAYILADRYVKPIHAVADAAQNIAARGLEPVPEAHGRDEVGLLTRSFNDMVKELRRAREREQELNRLERFTALGQLAGGLAHEIKNPLNFLSLALDQLRTRYAQQLSDSERFVHQVALMKDEVRRLAELVQSFLHYGQPVEIYPAPTDVRALVESVLAISESKMKSQNIEVIEDVDGVPTILNVDAEKIRTCFMNVVANAVQAMPEGGPMRIAFHNGNGKLVITFADSGQGIEPEVVEHVFEPFFTTKRDGIGLGLFFSRAIVERHGGAIDIGPNPSGRGTVVTFTFPQTATQAAS